MVDCNLHGKLTIAWKRKISLYFFSSSSSAKPSLQTRISNMLTVTHFTSALDTEGIFPPHSFSIF